MQMESGIGYGLSAALTGAITLKDGLVEQSNFHDYPVLRMNEMPRIETVIIPSKEKPTGVGECASTNGLSAGPPGFPPRCSPGRRGPRASRPRIALKTWLACHDNSTRDFSMPAANYHPPPKCDSSVFLMAATPSSIIALTRMARR